MLGAGCQGKSISTVPSIFTEWDIGGQMNVLHILSWPDSDEAGRGDAKVINEKV